MLDASVLVPSELRKALQRAAIAGLYQPVWSPWIIQETWRVLAWKWAEKFGVSTQQRGLMGHAANAMFFHLDEVAELVTPRPPFPAAWPTLLDPMDAPIYAASVEGRCSLVVSNNTRDFPPGNPAQWRGTRYVVGTAFLKEIGWS